jgi:hypothetical protein
MRPILLALLLLVGPVSAESPEPPTERVTFTRAELDQMVKELEAMVQQREAAARERWNADLRQRCPSLI